MNKYLRQVVGSVAVTAVAALLSVPFVGLVRGFEIAAVWALAYNAGVEAKRRGLL